MRRSTRCAARLAATAVLLLTACGSNPPMPDWQMTAKSSLERSVAAYMDGNSKIEEVEFARARAQLASTGKVAMVALAELTRCASRVAVLVVEECAGFKALEQDASAADRAYARYLAGRVSAADIVLLPEQHRAVAAAGSDATAAAAALAIADPLSRLVASGVLFKSGKATPPVLAGAVDVASDQGWRRPLLAWLGVQAQRAEQAGDAAEAQRIRRRMVLVGN
ncbi:hypothetical protein HSX11_06345 [Oxalobacteraceae bacterium]|nr:hypothetical protein [Oxalobacteraceae bacterium]